ncbi:MAG: sn-glycerol-3-phosphate ABC transporter ATP-binding protein UgpC [Methylobacteriaceae bacterium]|nr:sn-glycerol-3-phosphate ABC transporter ATP-binding protein UgpC [Methylobacteriaceae bacterium]
MAEVILKDIRKAFGRIETIHGVNLSILNKEFVVFVGPSGCGKSTLLRLIAGLEDISAGDLLIDGTRVNEKTPKDRGIAMVFQSYALYPHMTVYENMAFGLELAKTSKETVDSKVRGAAKILELTPLLDRLPKQLSGGQRQRVAIGRAIVREPKVFLFDEPLSNLDAALRVQMRIEIAKLHSDMGATMVYVTHDQVEAMTLADKIVVLNSGNVEQVGAPLELYHHPKNLFVAGFIGSPQMNFIDAEVLAADVGGVKVALPGGGSIVAKVAGGALHAKDKVKLGVRPEHLGPGSGEATIPGNIEFVEELGESHLLYVRTPDKKMLTVRASGDAPVETSQSISVAIPPEACHVFAADGSACRRLAA